MSAVREHPVIFSGHSVRAIVAGKKTQTRRLVTPATTKWGPDLPRLFWEHVNLDLAWVDGRPEHGQYLHVPCHRGDAGELDRLDDPWAAKGQPNHGYREAFPNCGSCEPCDKWGWRMCSMRLYPRWQVGDRLWVREAVRAEYEGLGTWRLSYAADGAPVDLTHELAGEKSLHFGRSRPLISPIFIPRWASRLSLRITSLRVQRLQEISEEDAGAEGIDPAFDPAGHPLYEPTAGHERRICFRYGWDALNAKRSPWASNPWVTATTFEVVTE